MKHLLRWWRQGYLVRWYAGHRDETGVATVTFFRIIMLGITVTEHVGVHITLSLKIYWAECSIGFAMWDQGVI